MSKKSKPVKPVAQGDDDFFQFEGANIHPSAKDAKKNHKAASTKSSKKPSPYTERVVIMPERPSREDDVSLDDIRARAKGRGFGNGMHDKIIADALQRKHGIHRHDPSKDGIVTKVIDRVFRTKKVSGVKVVGAESVTSTKLTEKQLRNEDAIAENLEMMEAMGDGLDELI